MNTASSNDKKRMITGSFLTVKHRLFFLCFCFLLSAQSQFVVKHKPQGVYEFQKAPQKKIKQELTYLETDSINYLIEQKWYDRKGYLIKRDSFGVSIVGIYSHLIHETWKYEKEYDSIVYKKRSFIPIDFGGGDKEYVCLTFALNDSDQIMSKMVNNEDYEYDMKNENSVWYQYNEYGDCERIVIKDELKFLRTGEDSKFDTLNYINSYDTLGYDHYQTNVVSGRWEAYNYDEKGRTVLRAEMHTYHIGGLNEPAHLDSNLLSVIFEYGDGRLQQKRTVYSDRYKASIHAKWFQEKVSYEYQSNTVSIKTARDKLEDEDVVSKVITKQRINLDKKKRPETLVIDRIQVEIKKMNFQYKKYWF